MFNKRVHLLVKIILMKTGYFGK